MNEQQQQQQQCSSEELAELETQGLLSRNRSFGHPRHQEELELKAGQPNPDRIGASSSSAADVSQAVAEPSLQGHAQRMKRLHEVWPSKNFFLFRGLCLTGGSDECFAANICVWCFILVPCSLYFFWVFPSLLGRGCYALPGATLAAFIFTTGSLLATCCTDPGIIPRRSVILATGAAAQLEEALGYNVLGEDDDQESLRKDRVPEHLSRLGYRWCRTCNIVRPPRASHCPDCDNCVLRYDHHCPFVNNCVGQRNYMFFFGFTSSVMVLAMMVIPAVITYFASIDLETSLKFMIHLSSVMWLIFYAMIAAGALVILAVLGGFLWVYHVFLICSGKTTKEFRKGIPNIDQEPVLCTPRGPRLFDPWALVDSQFFAVKP
jgi:hypothetical protein